MSDLLGLSPIESLGETFRAFLYLGSWMLIGVVIFLNKRIRDHFPQIIIFSILFSTAVAMLELIRGESIVAALGLTGLMAGNQMINEAITAVQIRDGAVRVQSVFNHPIVFGQLMMAMMPLPLHFLMTGEKKVKVIWIFALGAIILCGFLSNTRSALVVGIIAAVCYFALYFLNPRRRGGFLMIVGAAIASYLLAPVGVELASQIAYGRNSGEFGSFKAREAQIATGLEALEDRPVSGFGSGHSLRVAGLTSGRYRIITIDNFYLSSALEGGYLGLTFVTLLFFAIVLCGVKRSFSNTRVAQRSLLMAYTAMAFSLMCGLVVISIQDTLSVIFLLAGCLAAGLPKRHYGRGQNRNNSLFSVAR
ncbi:O-antigen ligase family protein [Tsuneonella sp. SYSU-LHT278]|uniref:O-antigen ligase family protein n=1 Tax=Tsuneonella sediminis TaxID=3416089 RepID=UPI003F7A49B3